MDGDASLLGRYHQFEQDFRDLGTWSSRYQHLVEMGRTLPSLKEGQRADSNLVEGCLSKVWLGAELRDGKLLFFGDSDAVMPRGLVALLVALFSGATPDEVRTFERDVFFELGLSRNLTPTRALAAGNMLRRVRQLADAHS